MFLPRDFKFISREVAELLARDIFHNSEKEPHDYLFDREFEVLKLITGNYTLHHIPLTINYMINKAVG